MNGKKGQLSLVLLVVVVTIALVFFASSQGFLAFIISDGGHTTTWQGYTVRYTLNNIQQVDANQCSWSSTFDSSQSLIIQASRSSGTKCAGNDINNPLSIDIPLTKNGGELQSVYINSVGTATKTRLGFASISSSIEGKQIAYTSSGTKEGVGTSSFTPIFLVINDDNIALPNGESITFSNKDNLVVDFNVLASNQQYNAEGGTARLEIKEIRTIYSTQPVVPIPIVEDTIQEKIDTLEDSNVIATVEGNEAFKEPGKIKTFINKLVSWFKGLFS